MYRDDSKLPSCPLGLHIGDLLLFIGWQSDEAISLTQYKIKDPLHILTCLLICLNCHWLIVSFAFHFTVLNILIFANDWTDWLISIYRSVLKSFCIISFVFWLSWTIGWLYWYVLSSGFHLERFLLCWSCSCSCILKCWYILHRHNCSLFG